MSKMIQTLIKIFSINNLHAMQRRLVSNVHTQKPLVDAAAKTLYQGFTEIEKQGFAETDTIRTLNLINKKMRHIDQTAYLKSKEAALALNI